MEESKIMLIFNNKHNGNKTQARDFFHEFYGLHKLSQFITEARQELEEYYTNISDEILDFLENLN